MQSSGDHLLAGAGFAGDQDGGAARSHEPDDVQNPLDDEGAGADQVRAPCLHFG